MSLTRSSRIALKHRFSVTLLLFVGVLLVAFPENFARPFIKQFATSLQAPAILIGLAVSIHTLSSGIVSPLGGLWSDKVGKRKPFVVGVILLAGSYVCALYATDIVSLLFARILTGIGSALVGITLISQLADSTDTSFFGSAMGIVSGVETFGMLLGPITCAIVGSTFGVSSIYLVPALGLIIPNLIFAFISKEPHTNRN